MYTKENINSSLMIKQSNWLSREFSSSRIFLFSIIIVNITLFLRLFTYDFLPFGDWIPHIYNSRIINELIFHSGSGISKYYEMYYAHCTNMTDHFIMAALMNVMSSKIASQIVIAMVFFSMQFGMYFLLKTLKINIWWTFLIIPFIFNSLFIGGMINYNIAIGLMLMFIALWIKYLKDPHIILSVALFFFPLIIYITHIFIYGIANLAVAVLISVTLIISFKDNRAEFFKRKIHLKRVSLFVFSNILSGIIFLQYFFQKTHVSSSFSSSNFSSQPVKELFSLHFLFGYQGVKEGHTFSIFIIALIALIVLGILTITISRIRKNECKEGLFSSRNNVFVITSLIMITLLFMALLLLPGKIVGAGSSIHKRVQLLLAIFMVIFIIIMVSKSKYEKISLLLIIPALISTYMHKDVICDFIDEEIYPVAEYLMHSSDDWSDYSSAMLVTRDTKWFMAHVSNALGAENKVICYENYEATGGHFLTARVKENPLILIDKDSRFFGYDEIAWELIIPDHEPDYLLMLQKDNPVMLPENLYSRYDTISANTVGLYRIIEMRRR